MIVAIRLMDGGNNDFHVVNTADTEERVTLKAGTYVVQSASDDIADLVAELRQRATQAEETRDRAQREANRQTERARDLARRLQNAEKQLMLLGVS